MEPQRYAGATGAILIRIKIPRFDWLCGVPAELLPYTCPVFA